jgi:hypothetical protein
MSKREFLILKERERGGERYRGETET